MGVGLWANGSLVRFSDSTPATDFKADLWVGILGADYQLGDGFLLGATLVQDRTVADTNFNGGSEQSVGRTIAPYGAYRFDPTFSIDGSGGYTWLDRDFAKQSTVGLGRVTGSTWAERWFVNGNLNANHAIDDLSLFASVGILYASETVDEFTQTDGDTVFESTQPLGQVRVRGRAAYGFHDWIAGGVVEPYISLGYDHDYQADRVDVGLNQAEHPNDDDEWTIGGGAACSRPADIAPIWKWSAPKVGIISTSSAST